jgi:hypothetical protein
MQSPVRLPFPVLVQIPDQDKHSGLNRGWHDGWQVVTQIPPNMALSRVNQRLDKVIFIIM